MDSNSASNNPFAVDTPPVVDDTPETVGTDHRLDAVWEALATVFDPELAMDIVSLGLVYDVREEEGAVVIEMTLTTPGCPVSDSLPAMARFVVEQALEQVPIDIRIVWDPPWNPTMMRDGAAAALGFRP